MNINTLVEVIWRFSQDGRVKATAQKIREEDILQEVKMALGKLLVAQYYDSRKQDEYLEADYSYYASLLTQEIFDLSDPDSLGKRSANMSSFQLYTLPKNKHITTAIPLGEGCNGDGGGNITMVAPGEENFYIHDPEMSFFKFFVVRGKGIDTYHISPCVKKIIIESTFDSDEMDISFNIAFDIANQILGVVLGIPDYTGKSEDNSYTEPQKILRRNMQQSPQG